MSTVVKDLGAVTAYADAVAAGYTGTKEEWQTLMASYASVAEEAQEAREGAEAAQDAAEDARDAAISAKTGAESAVSGFSTVVTQATNQAVQTVRAEGTTQVGNVSSEGTTQVAAVQAKGTEVIQSIPADYTQLSSDVTQLKEDLKNSVNSIVSSVNYSWDVSYDTAGNHTKYFGFTIPSGTVVKVSNLSLNTDITVIFRDANNVAQSAVTLSRNTTKNIALTVDATNMRSYVNGTEWKVLLEYGYNLQEQITSNANTIKALKMHSVDLYDGYYNSTGTIVESTENGAKYTDKIECFSGQKLHVSLALASTPSAFWLAKGEWKKDGTFVRTNIATTTVGAYAFDYVPDGTVERVAFMFYGWDSYTFEILSETDVQTVYEAAALSGIMRGAYSFDSHRVKGINHRGYNTVAPENTIPAFQLSVENGFSFVETDVRFTSDGIPVLLHDATVDRTSNGTGNIADMTYEQARSLDFGSWKSEIYAGTKIPSFDEFIVFCRNTGVYPYIEVSGAEFTVAQLKLLIDIVKKYGMERSVTWISFYKSNLVKISNMDDCARVGRIPSTALTESIAKGMSDLMTGRNEAFVSVDNNYLTNATVELCETYGLLLETWTVNTTTAMTSLPDMVCGVTSDKLNFETVIREKSLT